MFDVDFIYESKIIAECKAGDGCGAFSDVDDFLGELLRPYNLRYKRC